MRVWGRGNEARMGGGDFPEAPPPSFLHRTQTIKAVRERGKGKKGFFFSGFPLTRIGSIFYKDLLLPFFDLGA